MDPKSAVPVLDPKLKETYDRVMNTPVPPPVPPVGGQPTQPNPQTPPQPVTPQPIPPPPAPPQPPASQPSPPPWSPPVKPVSPFQPPAPIQSGPATTTVHATIPLAAQPKPASATIVAASSKQGGKGLRLFPILFAIGGLLFFAIYTIFWLKFFNLPIPFLPF